MFSLPGRTLNFLIELVEILDVAYLFSIYSRVLADLIMVKFIKSLHACAHCFGIDFSTDPTPHKSVMADIQVPRAGYYNCSL